jgi:hypothetical protein
MPTGCADLIKRKEVDRLQKILLTINKSFCNPDLLIIFEIRPFLIRPLKTDIEAGECLLKSDSIKLYRLCEICLF